MVLSITQKRPTIIVRDLRVDISNFNVLRERSEMVIQNSPVPKAKVAKSDTSNENSSSDEGIPQESSQKEEQTIAIQSTCDNPSSLTSSENDIVCKIPDEKAEVKTPEQSRCKSDHSETGQVQSQPSELLSVQDEIFIFKSVSSSDTIEFPKRYAKSLREEAQRFYNKCTQDKCPPLFISNFAMKTNVYQLAAEKGNDKELLITLSHVNHLNGRNSMSYSLQDFENIINELERLKSTTPSASPHTELNSTRQRTQGSTSSNSRDSCIYSNPQRCLIHDPEYKESDPNDPKRRLRYGDVRLLRSLIPASDEADVQCVLNAEWLSKSASEQESQEYRTDSAPQPKEATQNQCAQENLSTEVAQTANASFSDQDGQNIQEMSTDSIPQPEEAPQNLFPPQNVPADQGFGSQSETAVPNIPNNAEMPVNNFAQIPQSASVAYDNGASFSSNINAMAQPVYQARSGEISNQNAPPMHTYEQTVPMNISAIPPPYPPPVRSHICQMTCPPQPPPPSQIYGQPTYTPISSTYTQPTYPQPGTNQIFRQLPPQPQINFNYRPPQHVVYPQNPYTPQPQFIQNVTGIQMANGSNYPQVDQVPNNEVVVANPQMFQTGYDFVDGKLLDLSSLQRTDNRINLQPLVKQPDSTMNPSTSRKEQPAGNANPSTSGKEQPAGNANPSTSGKEQPAGNANPSTVEKEQQADNENPSASKSSDTQTNDSDLAPANAVQQTISFHPKTVGRTQTENPSASRRSNNANPNSRRSNTRRQTPAERGNMEQQEGNTNRSTSKKQAQGDKNGRSSDNTHPNNSESTPANAVHPSASQRSNNFNQNSRRFNRGHQPAERGHPQNNPNVAFGSTLRVSRR